MDTCAFLWFQEDSPKLSTIVRTAILEPRNDVFLSSVSVWEIALKYSLGKIVLPGNPSRLIPAIRKESGITSLPLTENDALVAESLEMFHKDPFDRMLIAQAVCHGMAIATCDGVFRKYPPVIVW